MVCSRLYESVCGLRKNPSTLVGGSVNSLFCPIVDSLLNHNPFLADFPSFLDCQEQISLNTARTGFFSSDRTIQESCQDIGHVLPVPIEVKPYDHNQVGQRL